MKPLNTFLLLFLVTLAWPAAVRAQPKADARPIAYVWEQEDVWTKSAGIAAQQLTEVGFEVRALPKDKSPFKLLDAQLIFLGSFVSEDPAYKAYMDEYADDLYNFVDKGRLLVQMTQNDSTEAKPPFLPTTQSATRNDRDFSKAVVLSPKHPLLEGIKHTDGLIQLDSEVTIWEAFPNFGGFEVLLAADDEAEHAAMMEGAYGQGRILLCAMSFDKGVSRRGETSDAYADARNALTKRFFINLRHMRRPSSTARLSR